MIALKKTAAPKILEAKAAEWRDSLLAKIAAREDIGKHERSKYNHPDVKSALIAETHGKCAYCESKLLHIAYGDIEHVVPKDSNPHLWFDWDNLTLACDVCNTKKGSLTGLLDPYRDNLSLSVAFTGETIWPYPGNDVAMFCIRALDLNRADLLGRRRERLEYLMALLHNIAKTKSSELRGILANDFLTELGDDKEYAAMARSIRPDFFDRVSSPTVSP